MDNYVETLGAVVAALAVITLLYLKIKDGR